MPVLVTCKFDEDLIKNEGAMVSTILSSLQVYGEKIDAQGRVTPKQIF